MANILSIIEIEMNQLVFEMSTGSALQQSESASYQCDGQCQSQQRNRDLNLVGESPGSEATSNWSSPGVRRKLQDRTLSIRPRRDDTDIRWVLNCRYCPRGKQQFLPRLLQVYDVDA